MAAGEPERAATGGYGDDGDDGDEAAAPRAPAAVAAVGGDEADAPSESDKALTNTDKLDVEPKEADRADARAAAAPAERPAAAAAAPAVAKERDRDAGAASRAYECMGKTELAALLDRHYKRIGPGCDGIKYSVDEIGRLLAAATESLQEQKTLVDVALGPGINIVGDVHGQFNDLVQILLQLGRPPAQRYLVLGDFVDRGRRGIDCACLLLAYKTLYPTHVYVLRGNHELAHINKSYGFHEECKDRFGDKIGCQVWLMFQRAFYHLPIFGLVEQKILCMHGGLSPLLKSLKQLRDIKKPMKKGMSVVNDGLWADPKYKGMGWLTNSRGTSFEFGPDVVESMCDRLGLDLIVRAHQVCKHGYAFFANKRMVTIFSAPSYGLYECSDADYNSGAVLCVSAAMECSLALFVAADSQRDERVKAAIKDGNKLPKQTLEAVMRGCDEPIGGGKGATGKQKAKGTAHRQHK